MDYSSTPVAATFVAETNTTTINIPLTIDDIAEQSETFDLNFIIPSSLSGRIISGSITNAIVNITDNTGKKIFWFNLQ